MHLMVIAEPLIDLVVAVRVALGAPDALVALVVSAALENLAVLAVSANLAVSEPQLDLRVEQELARGPVVVELPRGQPLAHPAERELLVLVAVRLVRDQPLDRAAAERIALVVTAHPAAEAVARSAAEAQTSLGPVVAEAVIAWVAAGLVAAVVAVVAAVEDAVVEDAAAVVDAGDEQLTNGIKTYEIEIKHHEVIKNFFTRLCDRHVRYGGIFIAGCARN
jgi:hypothetical protein